MAMPSSQNVRSESEMMPKLRPVMPVDLFRAAMKGDSDLLIRRLGLQPAKKECQVVDDDDITNYIDRKGDKFTLEWFDEVMDSPVVNKWEKVQAFGLGSVLITTVAFAAAFTIPGGYNQDNGTPVLGRRYMFRAFIIADTMAFIQGFICLSLLLLRAPGPTRRKLNFAISAFQLAASSMVMAFGLGLYLTLSPVCYPIAVFVLVITLIVGSPALLIVLLLGERYFGSEKASQIRTLMVSLLLIFCLGFM